MGKVKQCPPAHAVPRHAATRREVLRSSTTLVDALLDHLLRIEVELDDLRQRVQAIEARPATDAQSGT